MRTLALVAALAAGATGCTHITTTVPGVLDLRSDGSAATVETKAATGERSGFDAIMNGDGVKGTSDVMIEDRKYWVCSLFPVLNPSATEEISAAVGTSAMRNVRIGEQYTLLNWGVSVCVSLIPLVNIAGLVMPPRDFRFWGTRLAKEGQPPGVHAERSAAADGLPPASATPTGPAEPPPPAVGY